MITDFNWLKNQTDEDGVKTLELLEKKYFEIYEKGKISKNKSLFSLKLGDYNLWLRECSFHSSLDMYVDIFKNNRHFLLPDFYENSKTVIDCGAHEGYYTLRVKKECPQAKIIAVEPNSLNFEILLRNVKYNKLSDVCCINKALYVERKTIPFYFVEYVGSVGGVDPSLLKNLHSWIKGEIKETDIETITLPEVLGSMKVDILKLDIQGVELAVLEKERDLIKSNVKRIIVEYHKKYERDKLINLLESIDFELCLEEKNKFPADLYFIKK